MNFHSILRELRETKGLTQNEISKHLGIPRTTYAKWENNIRPGYETLKKLAEFFNVSVDYLLYGTEPSTDLILDVEILSLVPDGAGGLKILDWRGLDPEDVEYLINLGERLKKDKQKHQNK
jgi:transcriptional regulator with XRE-family HTH domain